MDPVPGASPLLSFQSTQYEMGRDPGNGEFQQSVATSYVAATLRTAGWLRNRDFRQFIVEYAFPLDDFVERQ